MLNKNDATNIELIIGDMKDIADRAQTGEYESAARVGQEINDLIAMYNSPLDPEDQ